MTDNKMHVLIVDDEERLVSLLQKLLSERGFIATGVTSGEDALDTLAQMDEVDVLLLDVKMGGMDGIQVLREVKKRFDTVQVVLYTGNATIQDGIDGIELGAFYYLEKPAPIDEIADVVQSACERRIRKYGNAV